MIDQAPVLIIIIPLMFAIITPLLGIISKKICYPWAILSLILSTICSFVTLGLVQINGTIRYNLGGWPPPQGIEYVIDHLNALMLVIISVITLLIAIYSRKSIIKEIPGKIIYFYTVLLLQITGFLGIVISGDLFNIYVFLEIASISGYALIAAGKDDAPLASFRYIMMGTVGASFYLLGIGYLYMATGSLNISDLAALLPELYNSKIIIIAFIMILTGISIKMAIPPLHSWISDAYTYAPSTTSALVAPLMTKISGYLMVRIMFTLFSPSFSITKYPITEILAWIAAPGILFAGIMALGQKDLKRMFTYVIIAEMGYFLIGISCGNQYGLTGAIFHILNDAFMMACLFTVAGAIYYQTGKVCFNEFTGLHRQMPVTSAIFVVAALSMIGVPPFCGFFSKWYLLLGTIESKKWILLAVLIISSLINAVLFFRVIENIYVERREEGEHLNHMAIVMDKAPFSMIAPMILIAAAIILIGIFNYEIVSNIITNAVPESML